MNHENEWSGEVGGQSRRGQTYGKRHARRGCMSTGSTASRYIIWNSGVIRTRNLFGTKTLPEPCHLHQRTKSGAKHRPAATTTTTTTTTTSSDNPHTADHRGEDNSVPPTHRPVPNQQPPAVIILILPTIEERITLYRQHTGLSQSTTTSNDNTNKSTHHAIMLW